ncbi:MAG: class aminotransferase [Anaerosolibacter sp.]|jgi:aspartate aminotransferase-like enzyme|uniref:pyridoxal-phosphate-dependent aminotransferase family protein n=1 Tax=Anaerosolibacter sp. TaxID=1872527 RepID=UPI002619355A|nr:alanine--glyoxylate aminotransferase family protein [Anaerosolibacter sp.]MDF2547404.1 class aminotransferase [Anaerosolibacter sp.]
MERRQYLQIPGPTNVPDRILRSLSKPLINHRGPEFELLVEQCIAGLKKVFRTQNDVLIFPSSGSGTLESAIVNLLSPGDTMVAVSQGLFSERMAAIGEKFGINVLRINKAWGEAANVDEIEALLSQDTEKKIKAVCLPQNETTSAITNDIEGIAKMMKKSEHPALLVVDAISSLACLPLETDEWGIDVVITASQKGLMLPPGLGIVSLNDRAWLQAEQSKMPKWYWDYNAVREKMKGGQFPYTPATTLLFGLKEALDILAEEGIEKVWERHELMGKAVRNAVHAMGLTLFAEEAYASDTVTSISMPEDIQYKELASMLNKDYGVVIGGGLQQLQGKIFRIGHLGAVHQLDVYAVMGAVEMTLYRLGYNVELGTAAKAVAKTFLKE